MKDVINLHANCVKLLLINWVFQKFVPAFSLFLFLSKNSNLSKTQVTYPVEVKMSASEFQKLCKDLNTVGDALSINCEKDKVTFGITGDAGDSSLVLKQNASFKEKDSDKDDTKSKSKSTSDGKVSIECKKPLSLTFSLKYMINFAKAASISDDVTLKMSGLMNLLLFFLFKALKMK